MEPQQASDAIQAVEPEESSFKSRLLGINRLLVMTVITPTLIAIIYFGFIASDIYISESRFVVRSPQRQSSATGLTSVLQGAGLAKSQDDVYTVHDYMLSRDALQELNVRLGIGKAFSDPDIDIFNRFGAGDDSFEALYRYYQKRVIIDTDATSSISSLKTYAFKAEDAYKVNELLLQLAEQLINKLNTRGREDMIQFAKADVAVAEKNAKEAALALSAYRSTNAVFDPERQSTIQLQQVSKLQDELIATKAQLNQVKTFTPENPQIPALQRKVEGYQAEIDIETSKIAGGNKSLTNKAADFQRLALDRDFADKQLAGTLASLEQARNDALRKQLYLERIVQPNKPDVGMEPRRLRAILSTFLLGLIAWGVLTILVAGVKEHTD